MLCIRNYVIEAKSLFIEFSVKWLTFEHQEQDNQISFREKLDVEESTKFHINLLAMIISTVRNAINKMS